MSNLFLDILTDQQKDTLKSLEGFSFQGVLAGGTGLALQLGHRRSYDLDIFSGKSISRPLAYRIKKHFEPTRILVDTGDELSIIAPTHIKISFVHYPFMPLYPSVPLHAISMASWKDIALDKAHTIGRPGAWRDYVDLYFCVVSGFSLAPLIEEAKRKFGNQFSEKLFLSQLSYFEDITDFSSVELLGKNNITSKRLERFFTREIKKIIPRYRIT